MVFSDCGLKIKNLVSGNHKQILGCPYFRKEGGGQEGYQNILIYYVLIRGRREGV